MHALDAFVNSDYLIPTLSKDGLGLIPRPSSPDRALRWLKAAVGRRGLQNYQVDKLSWHSFRVFIPDCAFQLRIPRDQRQYLGNWTTESTADIYTREKRNVVTRVWEEVANKLPSLNLGGARLVREDLDHPDWEDPMVVTIDDAGAGHLQALPPMQGLGNRATLLRKDHFGRHRKAQAVGTSWSKGRYQLTRSLIVPDLGESSQPL